MLTFMGDIIFIGRLDLYGRVLGIDLAFNETLKSFWDPDVEADLAAYRGDFKTEVFLDAVNKPQLLPVA